MKEFIEKLIGRLEETDFNDIQMVVREVLLKYGFPYESIVQDEVWDALDELSSNKYAISIVNELAEEYINTSTDSSTDLVDTSTNTLSGWVACSERLPETNKGVLVCTNEGQVDVDYYGEYTKDFIGLKGTEQYAIAWQPLPTPYKEGVTENE